MTGKLKPCAISAVFLISIIFIKGLDGVSAQTNLVRSVTISSQLTLVSKST